MQIFSYLPSAIFRTFGAVCSRNAPRRSIGGSTPWSKMRICVRSRMPMMWPCTVTSSPARSLRISCGAVIGNVTVWLAMARTPKSHDLVVRRGSQGQGSRPGRWTWTDGTSRLPVQLDGSVRGDVRGRAARGPALVVHGDGVERHVRVRVLDVAIEHRHVAAEAHRPDAGLFQQAHQLLLQLPD